MSEPRAPGAPPTDATGMAATGPADTATDAPLAATATDATLAAATDAPLATATDATLAAATDDTLAAATDATLATAPAALTTSAPTPPTARLTTSAPTPPTARLTTPALTPPATPAAAPLTTPDAVPATPFTRTTLWVVIAVAAVSLIAAAVLTALGDDLGGGAPSAGADTGSRSAIGHRGLVELLERLDVPVVRSRNDSAGKAANGLLVIAEPAAPDDAARQRLRALAGAGRRVLVVLPKWYGLNTPGDPWIDDVDFVPTGEVDAVLETLRLGGTVERRAAPAALRAPERLGTPRVREPQLITGSELEPLIDAAGAGGDAILLGKVPESDFWILTDPDVLNNHGLRDPANAAFAVALLDELRAGGPVVFDEVVHGYAQPPSLLRTLFTFPIVLATLQVLICALLAVWAAMVRFGPRHAAPPPLAPGKDFLIQNTAALLHYGGHHADALRRYVAQSAAAVRAALHAPALAPTAATAWLDRVGRTRGITESLAALERDAETADTPQRTLDVAERVHRWRMEMTHGSHRASDRS